MKFRIKVTPVTITLPDDQKLVDTPHFVAYSKIPSNRDFDPMHHRIDTADIIEFDQYNAARQYAEYCSDKNRAHRYAVTCPPEDVPDAVQYLLSGDDLPCVIDLLASHTDEALLLRGRYNAGKKQYDMGMIDHGGWSTIKNQIQAAAVKAAAGIAKK